MIDIKNKKEKLKNILSVFIMLTIMALCIFMYFDSFLNLQKSKSLLTSVVKNDDNIETNLSNNLKKQNDDLKINKGNAELAVLKQKVIDLEENIKQLQIIVDEKESSSKIEKTNIIIKDQFSGILFTIMNIEKKLQTGGNIKNDIIKLKVFSSNIPELLIILQNFEHVQNLTSSQKLINEFNSFARNIKSQDFDTTTIKGKILSFTNKYTTILNKKTNEDAVLLKLEHLLYDNNFVKAYPEAEKLTNIKEEQKRFITNIKNSYQVQQGVEDFYSFISNAINQKQSSNAKLP
jgi:hypothetical protein